MSSPECYPDKAQQANEVLNVLSHHLRREVVYFFENVTENVETTLNELASHIASRVPDRARDELSAELVHVHLPKLKASGWLDFDQRSEDVRYYGHERAPTLLEEVAAIFAR